MDSQSPSYRLESPSLIKTGMNLRDGIIITCFSVLFAASTLVSLGSRSVEIDPRILQLRYALIALSLGVLLLLVVKDGFVPFRMSTASLFVVVVWFAFAFFVILSGIWHTEPSAILTGIWFLVGVPIIFKIMLPQLRTRLSLNGVVAWSLMLGHIPYILISLLMFPVTDRRYSGVFANPNQLGMVGVMVAAGALVILVAGRIQRRRPRFAVLPGIALVGAVTVVLLSRSRTSVLTIVAMALAAGMHFLRVARTDVRSILRLLFVAVFILPLGIYFGYAKIERFLQPMMERFAAIFIGQNSALSGRERIWEGTIRDAVLLGQGSGYFMQTFEKGPHNSFIAVLGEFGIPAALFLVTYAAVSLLWAYRYSRYSTGDPYAHGPLVILVGFWVLSLGEQMFGRLGRGITLAAFISTGLILRSRRPS